MLGGQFAWTQLKPGARPTVHYFGADNLLWTRDGKDLSAVSRKPIPLAELVSVHQDMARQLGFR